MWKKLVSMLLVLSILFSFSATAFAAETEEILPVVVSDTADERVVVVDGVVASYNKNSNTVTLTQNGMSTTFSLETEKMNANANATYAPYATGTVTIRDETVWMHEYEYYKISIGKYYWCIDIPSLEINPNEWCDPITVSDDGSKAAKACAAFANYIDAAKENEVELSTYGGAILISAAVGFISKNLKFTKAAYIAACAAAGIAVTSDVAGIAGNYVNNILNARDEYKAVEGYLA